MGFKLWNPGDTLNAADVNNYLMRQSLIVCTSSTRPASPVAGMTVYETDTAQISLYTGSFWVNMISKSSNTLTGSSSTRANAAYGDLAAGTASTVVMLTGTVVLVTMTALLYVSSGSGSACMSFAVSGASTIAATDNNMLDYSAGTSFTASARYRIAGLTAGTNVFTPQFRVTGGATVTAGNICLIVECIPV